MIFSSDNYSPVPQQVMDALAEANNGYQPSYGEDSQMKKVRHLMQTIFEAPDAAVYLVIALASKAGSGTQGTTVTNQFVDIMSFFSQNILPELQDPDVNKNPILKADAMKFTQTFRNQLPKEAFGHLVPLLINHLASKVRIHACIHSSMHPFMHPCILWRC